MEIILNSGLEEKSVPVTPAHRAQAISRLTLGFVAALAPDTQYRYDAPPYQVLHHNLLDGEPEAIGKGFLGHLSHAYSLHRAIEIAPHDLWFIVLCELSNAIKAQPEMCRPLFTRAEGKTQIVVPTSDASDINLGLVTAHLREHVPVDIDLFVPVLSTYTGHAATAMYAAFCDGVQHYYDYMTFMCGLPKLRLTGTQEDWVTLIMSASKIREEFTRVGYTAVTMYLTTVTDIFMQIANSFKKNNIAFWEDIYTHKNVGSGQQLDINGWITQFYMGKRGRRLENFLTSTAIVPFKNIDTGQEYMGVYGGFKRFVTEDRFIKTGYAQIIYAKV